MNDGAMQPYSLTLDKYLDHAAKWHPEAEVVTARAGGATTRVGYAALRERALLLSSRSPDSVFARATASRRLPGTARPMSRHGMRSWAWARSCHTLNPRLTAGQTASMLRQSQAQHPDRQRRSAAAGARRSRSWRRCRTFSQSTATDSERVDGVAVQPLEALLADATPDGRRGAASTRIAPAVSASPPARPARRRASPIRIARAICTRCGCCRPT